MMGNRVKNAGVVDVFRNAGACVVDRLRNLLFKGRGNSGTENALMGASAKLTPEQIARAERQRVAIEKLPVNYFADLALNGITPDDLTKDIVKMIFQDEPTPVDVIVRKVRGSDLDTGLKSKTIDPKKFEKNLSDYVNALHASLDARFSSSNFSIELVRAGIKPEDITPEIALMVAKDREVSANTIIEMVHQRKNPDNKLNC